MGGTLVPLAIAARRRWGHVSCRVALARIPVAQCECPQPCAGSSGFGQRRCVGRSRGLRGSRAIPAVRIARSFADCARLDHVVIGGTALPTPSLKGPGLPRGHFWESLDAEVATLMEGVLVTLKDAGVVLIEADVPDAMRLDNEAGFPIALYETIEDLNNYLAKAGSPLRYADIMAQVASPDVKHFLERLLGENAVPEAVYRTALVIKRPALQASDSPYFRRHEVSAVLLPTTPLPAARIGEDETVLLNGTPVPVFPIFIRNCCPASVAGIPSISLPAAMTRAGMPLRIEIDGPAGRDCRGGRTRTAQDARTKTVNSD